MILILWETFSKDYNVSFFAVFKVVFSLIMCTKTFSERVAQEFATKTHYVFQDQISKATEGLTDEEKKV